MACGLSFYICFNPLPARVRGEISADGDDHLVTIAFQSAPRAGARGDLSRARCGASLDVFQSAPRAGARGDIKPKLLAPE